MRRQIISLVGIVVVAVAALVYTLAAGNEPLLGVDLQGGVSVVLQPTTDIDDDRLDEAVEIIRNRVDGLGVAEPEITRQGTDVLVQLPGVDEQERALEVIGSTGELRFRTVLQELGPPIDPDQLAESITVGGEDGAVTTTTAASTSPASTTTAPPGSGDATTTTGATAEDATTTSPEAVGFQDDDPATTTEVPVTTTEIPAATAESTTTAAPAPTTTAAPVEPDPGATIGTRARCLADFAEREAEGIVIATDNEPDVFGINEPFTPPEDDILCDDVVMPQIVDGAIVNRFLLGPTAFTGEILSGASASFVQFQWTVLAELRGGADGQDLFNEAAATCVAQNPACPNNRFAFVLDGEVVTAPQFQVASFDDVVSITGQNSQQEAEDIALTLRYGSLPVAFDQASSQIVSATIGEDALDAGVVAGLIGLFLVAVYLIGFYRYLGLVAIASLFISTALLWSIISWLGASQGLALSLAGVTGIIVSIGVSVDSNIVYFEHLREDIHDGRTPRSAVDRAFPIAFSTIVKADVASLIGALLLYRLTTGAVKGFALYLGLATVLDLVATYFFMGPAVRLLARWRGFYEHPSRAGLTTLVVTEETGGPS